MIEYVKQGINPINLASITDMAYSESYRKEMLTNPGYRMVRCVTEFLNGDNEPRQLSSVLRVPNGESIRDFAKQYTKSDTINNVVEFFLEGRTLLSYDYDNMQLAYYDDKGELIDTIGAESPQDGANLYNQMQEELNQNK